MMVSRRHNSFLSFRMIASGLLTIALSMAAVMHDAVAQDAGMARELDRLKQDIADLQRTVYKGDAAPSVTVSSSSDVSELPDSAAARLQLRVQQLESQMRAMNGRIEEVGYQVGRLSDRLDKLIGDVDYRLRALEGNGSSGQLSSAFEPQGGTAMNGSGTNAPADQGQISQGQMGQGSGMAAGNAGSMSGTAPLSGVSGQPSAAGQPSLNGQPTLNRQVAPGGENAPGTKVFGQLTKDQYEAFQKGLASGNGQETSTQGAAQATAPAGTDAAGQAAQVEAAGQQAPTDSSMASLSSGLPDGSPQDQYNYSFGLLQKRDFAAAESAFKQFMEKNADSPLAGNAMYWLGETYYVRENFRDAATTFLDAYTKYPKGAKASHSLLKLGLSLSALGKKEAACAALGELKQKFPDAEARILSRAATERKSLSCPN